VSFGKTKLLVSFAFFGFLIGVTTHFVFDWLFVKNGISPFPIIDVIFTPWFLSGIAGSVLAVMIIFVSAHFLREK